MDGFWLFLPVSIFRLTYISDLLNDSDCGEKEVDNSDVYEMQIN